MHVEDQDWVPPTLLHTRWFRSAAEILGGVGLSSIVAVSIGLSLLLYAVATEHAEDVHDESPAIEEEVIAARFLKLGRDFREELPNRNVPLKSTAPDQRTAISKRPQKRHVVDAGVRPPDPMEDDLTRLLDRADLFAEIAEQQEREGSPDGIEEGTESMATAGDVYRGQLYVFFRRGWSIPTTISDEERRDLSVEATIEVADNLRITSFRLRGQSGNADFDQSVVHQLERLRRDNLEIPEPPMLERDRWVGRPFTLRFRGRDAR